MTRSPALYGLSPSEYYPTPLSSPKRTPPGEPSMSPDDLCTPPQEITDSGLIARYQRSNGGRLRRLNRHARRRPVRVMALVAALMVSLAAPASLAPGARPAAAQPTPPDYTVGDEDVRPVPAPDAGGAPAPDRPGGGPVAPPRCQWVTSGALSNGGPDGVPWFTEVTGEPVPGAVFYVRVCDGVMTGEAAWSVDGPPVDDAPPDAAALAEVVRVRLEGWLPAPEVQTNPPPGVAAIVGFPSFLEVTNWTGPVTDQECAPDDPDFCVTVLAVPSLSWSPGEPGVADVACTGAGTTFDPAGPPPHEQAAAPGACAHTYEMRTGVPDRPAEWPGVATVAWELTYTAPSGPGVLPDVVKAQAVPRPVDEAQTVIVRAGPGGSDR